MSSSAFATCAGSEVSMSFSTPLAPNSFGAFSWVLTPSIRMSSVNFFHPSCEVSETSNPDWGTPVEAVRLREVVPVLGVIGAVGSLGSNVVGP